ncbi:MAG: amidophosphoribosyltransferase, partial [Treponema sp.]|nr:amidophosphoribosyltransferase [Treponema sp.]
MNFINDDKLHEECGVFGVFLNDPEQDAASIVYYGLFSLQHRGQESTGIAAVKDGHLEVHKGIGLVGENFTPGILEGLKGSSALGHVRYSTSGSRDIENAQPFAIRLKRMPIALAHNGTLTNANILREQLEDAGIGSVSSGDSEVIANLIAMNNKKGLEKALDITLQSVKGSYALTIIAGDTLVGARDPSGIRPLCLGQIAASDRNSGGWILSSESCAITAAGGVFVRDIEPGETVIINRKQVQSFSFTEKTRRAGCSFEYVYFARHDSVIDGIDVYHARIRAGEILGKESKVEADLVIGVPDSGIPAAIGYGRETGTHFGMGIVKNKYIGRTFIAPEQALREKAVFLKHYIIRSEVMGKRIVLIDDSIVRGTTSRRLVSLLRNAGAKEVHIRVCSPPVRFPCYFGIDT